MANIRCLHLDLPPCLIAVPSLYLPKYCKMFVNDLVGLDELKLFRTLSNSCENESRSYVRYIGNPWLETHQALIRTAAWITRTHPTMKSAVWNEQNTVSYDNTYSIIGCFDQLRLTQPINDILLSITIYAKKPRSPHFPTSARMHKPVENMLLNSFDIRQNDLDLRELQEYRRPYFYQATSNAASSEATTPSDHDLHNGVEDGLTWMLDDVFYPNDPWIRDHQDQRLSTRYQKYARANRQRWADSELASTDWPLPESYGFAEDAKVTMFYQDDDCWETLRDYDDK